jgi:membrane-associated phospholipid phosphatase
MTRAVGVTDLLASAPDWAVAVFALVTQLGDAWFLFGTFALVYWLAPARDLLDRRAGATLIGLGLAAVGLTLGAKSLFALPRPPGAGTGGAPAWLPAALDDLYVRTVTSEGFGFPSGHALGSTVAYGGLALLVDVWKRRRRLLAAGLVAGLVSLSRLVLGVHYLVDVLAGMALGVVVLRAAMRLTDRGRRPARLFALAVAVGVAGAGLSLLHAGSAEATSALGAAVGGLVGWRYADGEVAGDRGTVSLPVASVGLVASGGLFAGAVAVASPLPVVFLVTVVSVGLVLALPALVGE